MIFTLKYEMGSFRTDNHDLGLCEDVLIQLGCKPRSNYRLAVRKTRTGGFTKINLRYAAHAGDYFFNIKGVDTVLNCFGNYQTARLITTLLGGKNGDLYFKFTEINS